MVTDASAQHCAISACVVHAEFTQGLSECPCNQIPAPPFLSVVENRARLSKAVKKDTFSPYISADEWQLILTALRPYRHNKDYRALLEHLQDQLELPSDPHVDPTHGLAETKNAREG